MRKRDQAGIDRRRGWWPRLLDSNSNVVHTWFSSLRPGLSADMEADGTLLRAVDVTPFTSGGASGGPSPWRSAWQP